MVTPPQIALGTIGWADSLILMVLALVVFGPRRLPQIGRQVGKLMYEFRKASNDFKFQMEEELRVSEEADRRKKEEEERQRTLALSPPAQSAYQTVESQAAVGAVEAPAAAAESSPYPGEGSYPAQYPPETPAAQVDPLQQIPYPRIQPPSTGAPVAATKEGPRDQGAEGTEEPAAEAPGDQGTKADAAASSAELQAENAATSAEPDTAHEEPQPDSARTEPVSQHG